MSAFSTHFAFEFRTGIRNKNLLLMNYLFPLGLYVMMSLIMPGLNPLFRDVIIPGMITFGILASALLGLPDPLVNAREAGIFRSYKINGVPAYNILLIPALSTILHIAVVAIIIVVTAPIFFNAPAPTNLAAFALVVLAAAVACTGLAVLIGVIAPNSRLTILFSQAIFLPSMLIGGIMIPYDMLPGAAGKVALLLPATYAMNAFKGLAMGGRADFTAWGSLLILFVGGVLAFCLALYLFSWDSRNTERRGHPALALLALLPYAAGLLLVQPYSAIQPGPAANNSAKPAGEVQTLELKWPASGETVDPLPILQWVAFPGASQYEVWVVDSTSAQVALNQVISDTHLPLTTPLVEGSSYDWIVQASGANGTVMAELNSTFMVDEE